MILVVMYIVMKKSKLGYEITAIGKNFEFAEATGMNVGKKIMIIMAISGALAGIAGAGWMMEDQYSYTLSFSGSPGLGWDGMLIALMGGHDPLGIDCGDLLCRTENRSRQHNMYTSVPKEIVALIQGLLVLFLAVKFINERFHLFGRHAKRKEA